MEARRSQRPPSRNVRPLYRRTQAGTTLLVVCAVVLLAVGGAELAGGQPGAAAAAAATILVVMLAFSRMTITVTTAEVAWSLGLSFIGARIAIDDIDAVSTETVPLLHGLGLRTSDFSSWTWIVDGRTVIVLQRRDGRQTRLGSADPDGVVAAVQAAIHASVRPN